MLSRDSSNIVTAPARVLETAIGISEMGDVGNTVALQAWVTIKTFRIGLATVFIT